MFASIRTLMVAAGAAAFMTAQTAYAAPTIDPLVSLSAFGTVQSRAAVCAAGASAAAAGAAAVQSAAPGCVLPVTEAPPPPVAQPAPPPPAVVEPVPSGGLGIGTLPLLLGLAAIAGLAAWLLSKDDNDGDLSPVSPA